VCYHESGHALIAEITEGAKKVKKVSVVPRGMAALGYTLNTPEENKYLMQKHELIAEIDVLLGGRAAEEVFIGEISTGASNDLERATDIIKSMVKVYGMSDVAGLMVLEKQNNQFLGGGFGSQKDYSERISQEVDDYIKELLSERYKEVKFKLNEYKDVIEAMVKDLREKEVISGERVNELIKEFSKSEKTDILTKKGEESDEKDRDNS
jgi:cell division protease FtsH